MTRRTRAQVQGHARLGGRELEYADPLLDQVAKAQHEAYLARRNVLAPLPPTAERSTMTETRWQNLIRDLCKRLDVYAYHPQLSRWSARGWPDLSLLGRRALFIECKDDKGTLSEDQVMVIDRMLAAGLEVHVLRPWHGIQNVADILTAGRPVPMAADYRTLWETSW